MRELGHVAGKGRAHKRRIDRVCGPWENYPDRNTASFVGKYRTTVEEMFVPYMRPQDNGCRTDVRRAAFADRSGRGIAFVFRRPASFTASRYTWEDLYFSRHQKGDAVFVNIDPLVSGLGDFSYLPLEKYRFDSAAAEWTETIEPCK